MKFYYKFLTGTHDSLYIAPVHIIIIVFSHLIRGDFVGYCQFSISLDDDRVNLTAGSAPFLMPRLNSEYDSRRASKPTTDDLVQALEDVRLGYILPRLGTLDSMHEWSSVLSLGEQQRLAFARILLSKPQLALMDEATSALDEANEAHLYQKIEAAGITYISVGHRRTLQKHHNMMLCIASVDPSSNDRNWYIEPINTGLSYNISTT